MGLLNRGIQYDQRWAEKAFLINGYSLLVALPELNAMLTHVAVQHTLASSFTAAF
jgi:hypothetical protein